MRGRTHRLHTSGGGVPSLTPGRDGRHSSRVPLPLVSFGGSAVMTVMLCLGLLMALERQQRTVSRLI